MMSMSREQGTVIRSASALLFERLVRLGFGFAVSALLARHLGAIGYGQLSYGLAVGTIAAGISQVGLDAILVREFATRPAEAGALIGTSFVIRSGVSLLCWLGVLLLFKFLKNVSGIPPVGLIAITSLTAIQSVASIPVFWFQANNATWLSSNTQLAVFVTASLARLVLVFADCDITLFAWLAALEIAASALVLFIQLRFAVRDSWRVSPSLARELLALSWPIWVGVLGYFGYTRLDQLLLSSLGGQRALGYYAAALRLTEQGQLLPAVLATPMLSFIVGRGQSSNEFKETSRIYASVSTATAYAFVFFIFLISPILFHRAFGPAFEPSISIARVQALAVPFIAVGFARNQFLIAAGETRFLMITAFLGMGVNVALNIIFIPKYGGLGAAASAIAAQATAMVLSTWMVSRLRWLAKVQLEALLCPWRPIMLMLSRR